MSRTIKKSLCIVFLFSFVQFSFAQESESPVPIRDVAKSGIYIEGLAAYGVTNLEKQSSNNPYTNRANNGGIGIRFGNEWYFKETRNRKIGLNVIWASTSIIVGNNLNLQILPLNVGLTNIWKLKERLAVELNLNLGYALRYIGFSGNTDHGIAINPEVKLRIGSALIGLGYQYIRSVGSYYKGNSHYLVLSVGMIP